MSRDRYVLCGILGVAVLLRVIGLNAPLWFDEIATVVEFLRKPTLELLVNYSSFNNHVFYSLQAKTAIALFGEHNWSVRLPAFLFGLAGIWAIWRLARSVVGIFEAHVTAALVAVSYHHVWFTQNARSYTELMFWWVLGTMVFVAGIRKPNWKVWVLYGAVVGAAMYTHLTAGFFVAAHGIIYCLLLLGRYGGGNRLPTVFKTADSKAGEFLPLIGFFLGAIFTLLLYAPSLANIVELVTAVPSTSEVDVMQEYQNPLWTMTEVIRSLPGPTWATTAVVFFAGFLVLVGAGGIGRREPIVAAVALIHIPLTFALLMLMSMRIWPRFFFADLAFIMLLLTHGVFLCCRFLSGLADKWTRSTAMGNLLFPLAAALMILISVGLLTKNYRHPKQDLVGALRFIETNQAEEDAVAAVGWASYPYNTYWEKQWYAAESDEDLRNLMAQGSRTWVVVVFPGRTQRRHKELYAVLGESFVLQARFPGTLGDGSVLVYANGPDKMVKER